MESHKEIFKEIYLKNKYLIDNGNINLWKSKKSVSGLGSEIENNVHIINEIQHIISRYNIKSMLDLPCGDFNWMSKVNLQGINYMGADIVEELIQANKIKYPNIKFETLNILTDKIPDFDLIMIRDCFIHFSDKSIFTAIQNIKKSNIKYVLTTIYTNEINIDIRDGGYRRINLLTHPFSLIPIMMLNELSGEVFTKNKYLALFRKEDL